MNLRNIKNIHIYIIYAHNYNINEANNSRNEKICTYEIAELLVFSAMQI